MKKYVRIVAALVLLLGCWLVPGRAQAQIQLNLTGNYLAPVESGSSFSNGSWGGGVTGRYFLNRNLAVGLNARYFSQRESASSSSGGITATATASVNRLQVTAQGEYFFNEVVPSLRPYAGLEAGMYRTAYKIDLTTNAGSLGSVSDNFTNFGFAPKAGVQYALTPALGVNVDAGLHLIFGEGTTSTALLLGLGVYYNLGSN
ncbi:OmpW family outer membrane protein [Spirosoma sordidisoli]|uniref:Porin family protein n=1 Tax=Spirosoma sordidisoli TaxID=2502893 RepID=A0A4Q2UVT2_9BACT|nr:OmpW family outer membrane protein [Spirosoma sordidisoli]RYC72131.1 porin family protein [Spirosoma sordidisoli]